MVVCMIIAGHVSLKDVEPGGAGKAWTLSTWMNDDNMMIMIMFSG